MTKKKRWKGSGLGHILPRLIAEQGGRCAYCGMRFRAEHILLGLTAEDTRATADHVIPRQAQGSDRWENLVAACSRCNNRRGHEDALEFFDRKGWLTNRQLRIWSLPFVQAEVREAMPLTLQERRKRKAERGRLSRKHHLQIQAEERNRRLAALRVEWRRQAQA